MRTSTDYTKLAATLDYAALEKKLAQLAQGKPPRQRKTVTDVLEPLRERLLDLQRKGWSSGQLAEELNAAGIPVSAARLRECLNRWTEGETGGAKSPTRRRRPRSMTDARPATATNQVARGQGASGNNQTGL